MIFTSLVVFIWYSIVQRMGIPLSGPVWPWTWHWRLRTHDHWAQSHANASLQVNGTILQGFKAAHKVHRQLYAHCTSHDSLESESLSGFKVKNWGSMYVEYGPTLLLRWCQSPFVSQANTVQNNMKVEFTSFSEVTWTLSMHPFKIDAGVSAILPYGDWARSLRGSQNWFSYVISKWHFIED